MGIEWNQTKKTRRLLNRQFSAANTTLLTGRHVEFNAPSRMLDKGRKQGISEIPIRSFRKADLLQRLWLHMPEQRDKLRPYADRASAYRNDCGCSMGGFFLVGSVVLLVVYRVFFPSPAHANWLATFLRAAGFVLSHQDRLFRQATPLSRIIRSFNSNLTNWGCGFRL